MAYSDVDGDSVSTSFVWDVDGSSYTGSSLDLTTTSGMPNSIVTCTVSVTDSQGATVSDSDSITIDNRLPAISTTVSAQGSGNTAFLTCLGTASDADDSPNIPTVTYSWSNSQTILGSNSTLQLDSSMGGMGDTITCTATATDLTGASSSDTDSYQISNSAPIISQITLSPSFVQTNDTITATPIASDAENDAISFNYDWFLNSQVSPAQTGSSNTLDGTLYFAKGDSVFVRVTPSDSYGSGTPVDSSPLIIENTAPNAPAIEINPPSPASTDDLICSVAQLSSDDDGDVSSYSYQWFQNGSASVFSSSDTISSADTQDGDSWECVVTPFDGTDSGTTASIITNVGSTCVNSSLIDLNYDQLHFVIAHDSGGYLLAGVHNGQALVVMLDSFANVLWDINFTNGHVAYHLVQGASQNVVVGDGSAGPWAAAFDDSGNILWEQNYASGNAFEAVATDNNGSFYIGGFATPAASVHKIDSSGNIQWTETMATGMYYVHSIEVVGSEVWAVGFQTNYPSIGLQSMMLKKLDASTGSLLSSDDLLNCGSSVAYGELSQPISNGDRMITGSGNGNCSGNSSTRSIATVTVDGSGAVTGQQSYSSNSSSGANVYGVASSMNDDFWILGQYSSTGLIINVDSSLNENWRLETIPYPRSAAIRPEGGMLVVTQDGWTGCLSDSGTLECCGF